MNCIASVSIKSGRNLPDYCTVNLGSSVVVSMVLLRPGVSGKHLSLTARPRSSKRFPCGGGTWGTDLFCQGKEG